MTANKDNITTDGAGFIYVDELRTPVKLDYMTGELEFYDKNRYTAARRGTPFVRVSVEKFHARLKELLERGQKNER